MQATADVTKKESSWSSWKGQGTDVFTVICSSVCLCFVDVRDGLFSLYVGYIYVTLYVCILKGVCVCVLCMSPFVIWLYLLRIEESNSTVYLRLLSHGHALMTYSFCCMCVCVWKKNTHTHKELRRVTDAGGCNGKKMYTHQSAGNHLFWVHVNMDASVVLWTKARHCCHPPHFAAAQGSWFYMAYALFLCNEAVWASGQALTDCLHGNQGTPILITSALSPRLPWHLAETGPEKSILRLPVFIAWRARRWGQERKWRPFLHVGCGLLSAIFLSLAQQWKCNRMHFLYPCRR